MIVHPNKSKRIIAALLFNIWFLASCKGLNPSIPLPAKKTTHEWMQVSNHKPVHLSKEETAVLKQEDDQLKSTQLQGDTESSLTYRFLDDFTFIEGVKGLEAHVHDGITKASLLVDCHIASRLPQLSMSGAGLEKVKELINQGYYPYKRGNQVYFDIGLLGGGGGPSKRMEAIDYKKYIPRNWEKKPTIKTLKEHTHWVLTLIELSDGTLASGSRDNTIRLWDRAGNCIKTLQGHNGWVYTLIERSDGTLASGSEDLTIKIWVQAVNCIRTVEGHISDVTMLIELRDGNLASGSADKTIKIWDRAGNCLNTFEANTECVQTLIELRDGTLASGGNHGTISLWDRVGNCIQTFKGRYTVRTLIELSDGNLASGSVDGTIEIWDRSGNCIQTFERHGNGVNTLIELRDGNLASGASDGTIKIWDRAGNCIQTIEGHADAVFTLIELSDGNLASGSADKTIKIWSFPRQDPALVKLVKRPSQKKPATPTNKRATVSQPLTNKEDPAILSRLGFKHYGKKEYQQAFELFQKAASQGDIDAQAALGSMYCNGEGVAKDLKQGALWTQKSAEKNNVQAQMNLGVMYENGLVLAKDNNEAIKWYRKAAEQGNQEANKALGRLQANQSNNESIEADQQKNTLEREKAERERVRKLEEERLQKEKAQSEYVRLRKLEKEKRKEAEDLSKKEQDRQKIQSKPEQTSTSSNPTNLHRVAENVSQPTPVDASLQELQASLSTLIAPEYVNSIVDFQKIFVQQGLDITKVNQSVQFVQIWQSELETVASNQKAFEIKTQEQQDLINHPNSNVGDYYTVAWTRLSDTILACKTMHSGHMANTFNNQFDTAVNFLDTLSNIDMSSAAEKVGSAVHFAAEGMPFVSIAANVLKQGLQFVAEKDKKRAVTRLATLCREISQIDRLTEEVARQLTYAKLAELENLPQPTKKPNLKERLKTRFESLMASEYTTAGKKLGLQDVEKNLKAIAGDQAGVYQEPDLVNKLLGVLGILALPTQQAQPVTVQQVTQVVMPSLVQPELNLSFDMQKKMFEEFQAMQQKIADFQAMQLKVQEMEKEREQERAERIKERAIIHKLEAALKKKEKEGEDTDNADGTQVLVSSTSEANRNKGAAASLAELKREIALHEQRLQNIELGVAAVLETNPSLEPADPTDREALFEKSGKEEDDEDESLA